MNDPHDQTWHNLIALSAPAYSAAAGTPPYGFTTRMLARLRAEQGQQMQMERIGLRAIFAAFALLVITGIFTLGLNRPAPAGDLEPGLRGFLQAADAPLS